MADANFDFNAESFKNQDNGNAAQLSAGALALLKERPEQAKPAAVATLGLPEITFFGANNQTARPKASSNPNMAMGNPSEATPNVANSNNYLLVKDQYTMSYNKDHKTPNWVSWQLDEDWIGSTGRTGPFSTDESLPANFERATPNEYSNTGYDRGHNTPSGDRTASHDDNLATFEMSNIAPQTPDNNRGPWEKLESYSRELAHQGKELYVIAGNEGSKGTIGHGINIPTAWWKVVVVLPKKGMGAADVTADTEIIAVEIPNTTGIMRDDWQKYTTTVSELEKHTGYNFLSNVPSNIQKIVENKKYSKPH